MIGIMGLPDGSGRDVNAGCRYIPCSRYIVVVIIIYRLRLGRLVWGSVACAWVVVGAARGCGLAGRGMCCAAGGGWVVYKAGPLVLC